MYPLLIVALGFMGFSDDDTAPGAIIGAGLVLVLGGAGLIVLQLQRSTELRTIRHLEALRGVDTSNAAAYQQALRRALNASAPSSCTSSYFTHIPSSLPHLHHHRPGSAPRLQRF